MINYSIELKESPSITLKSQNMPQPAIFQIVIGTNSKSMEILHELLDQYPLNTTKREKQNIHTKETKAIQSVKIIPDHRH